MSDLVGNPEDRFSRVAAHMRCTLKALKPISISYSWVGGSACLFLNPEEIYARSLVIIDKQYEKMAYNLVL